MPKLLNTPLGQFWTHDEGTVTRALENGQWWDVHLKPILDEAARGVALDLGAHIGWFTVYLSIKHYVVIACEPWPSTFALLRRSLAMNLSCGGAEVQTWPVAAYDTPTTLRFALKNDRSDAGGFSFTPTGDFPRIAGVPLDMYMSSAPPVDAPVTVIKTDCQGADLRALVGLVGTIKRYRPLIVFEWEETQAGWHGDTWDDYLRFFTELNYSVDRITTDFWDYVARPQ